MAPRSPATLGRLLDRLGLTLLSADEDTFDATTIVRSVAVYDSLDPQPLSPDALVLGVGIADGDYAADLLHVAGASGAAGVVLREPLATHSAVRRAAHETTVPVFGLIRGASWIQITSVLASALGVSDDVPANADLYGDAESDLFAMANSIAAMVDGPVTIENTSSSIIAFSADQDEADDARKESVLGHQVPTGYNAALNERGIFAAIYASASPVYVNSIGPGIRPRTAMRLQAGGEILGSIWAVVDSPLSHAHRQGLVEAANVVALTMLRARVTNDSASRFRSSIVSALIDGGTAARDAAGRAGMTGGQACVLVLGIDTAHDSSAEMNLQRLTSAFTMYLRASWPHAQAALLGETVYAVLPLAARSSLSRVRGCAEDFLARLRNPDPVLVGIGPIAEDVSQLSRSRRKADMVLRVLRTGASDGSRPAGAPRGTIEARQDGERRIATNADVQIPSLLLRMSDILADSHEEITGPLLTLAEYDEAHDAELVATLRAWLEYFGDVVNAAASLHIHKNTFRYRLKRLREVAGVDLDNPDQRFGLMLQLRLFALNQ